MSVLETPRILFRGNVAWDPIVTNNSPPFYNEFDAQTVLPTASSIAAEVQAFRREAIVAVMPVPGSQKPNRNWNPQGTHRSTFFDSAVSGVDLGKGVVGDPFVQSNAQFQGMLVDLEPYGAYSSQLFFDTMQFGVDGGYRIRLPRSARFTDRYINLSRNLVGYITGLFSVTWQCSFALEDGLTIDAFDSPALKALQAAMGEKGVLGLTVRWVAYNTYYYDDPALATDARLPFSKAQELIDKLNGGGFQPNPARSNMVGMIGLWREGEPPHEPGDRALLPNVAARPTTVSIQAAHARFTGNRLAIDLSNSTPELNQTLVKDQKFGDLTVKAVDPKTGALVATLGTIPKAQYDKAAYERGSGVVTLECKSTAVDAAKNANLVISQADGSAVLTETPYRVIPLVPNLYLDEGDHTSIRFQAYCRGVPAREEVPLTLYTMDNAGDRVLARRQTKTDSGGRLSFGFTAGAGNVFAYVPAPYNVAPPTQGIDPMQNCYMYVRVLPADAHVAALEPSWDNVYTFVLANWNAMAPCMDNWLMLDDPQQVKSHGRMLKALTNPDYFEAFRFMPVTRDISAGGRALLYKFLDAPEITIGSASPGTAAQVAASPAPPPAEGVETEEERTLSPIAAAMRAMRHP